MHALRTEYPPRIHESEAMTRVSRARTARERGGAATNLLAVMMLAGGGAAWWYMDTHREIAPLDEARIVTVQRQDLLKAVLATGRIEPEARVDVMSRASGIVKTIYVDDGDEVAKDQVLAELDREQLLAQHDENLANLEAAMARLAAAKARLDESRVRLEDPEVEFAARQVKRIEDLFVQGDESATNLDDARLKLRSAQHRIDQTRANIPVLEAGVLQAEADLKSAQASADRTATSLREATIKSPIDGIVLIRDKEVGDGVSSILTAGGNATKLMTLGDLSKIYVIARVDEVDVGRIHMGMRAVITSDAYRERVFEGEVVRIAPAGTVDGNGIVSFEVKISVKDPQKMLRVDMTANTKLVLEERKDGLALPQKALARAPKGWKVERVVSVMPPLTEEVEVKIGVSDGLITEIAEGLAEGDRVLLPGDRPMRMG
jgi:HlyD family secretion protein